jgi:tetrahydromethanopterin S-methyltransferase subunit B
MTQALINFGIVVGIPLIAMLALMICKGEL